jgi:hypothetical protein
MSKGSIPPRPWTPFEHAFVAANYYRIPAAEIGAMLGRNKGAVVSVVYRDSLLKPDRVAAA